MLRLFGFQAACPSGDLPLACFNIIGKPRQRKMLRYQNFDAALRREKTSGFRSLGAKHLKIMSLMAFLQCSTAPEWAC
jgi:hypothetical protein